MKILSKNTAAASVLAFLGLSSIQAAPPATAQALITGKAFYGIPGTAISALTNNAKFPNNPDELFFFPYFEWAATGDIATAPGNFNDNYGGQIVGYFHAPTSGNYVFWLAADDNAVLYLSPNSNPSDKKLIAQETVWSNFREYTLSGGVSDLAAKDSSQFAGTQWTTRDPALGGAQITLQAGQAYYIEALFKEGTGGDNLSVAVQDPSSAIDPSSPIPGQYLSTDRNNGAVSIVTQPQSLTVDERGSATFNVLPDGTPPYTFQWRKHGADITDATNLTYTVASVAVADNNAKFSVKVTGGQGEVTSQDAVLTVTPDTTLPRIASTKGNPNLTEVALTFSEPIEAASANTTANYQISSAAGALNVTGAALSASGRQVTLTTAPQTLGTKYTVLVSNVKDTAATPNTIAPNSKGVFFPTGKLIEANGFIVFEAENYDRNLDDLWVRDTQRGNPSGGVSMVNPNGAGGSETATRLEYDVEFKQAAVYNVWFRASGDNGNDDSGWFHLDGERPAERVDGNQASMTGFQPQSDFVWSNDSQDGPDPFTVEISAPGPHVIGLARREDGSFFDKFVLTTNTTFAPTGLGPPETREGIPGLPIVSLTAPAGNQTVAGGGNITLTATAAGASGLEIEKVEFTANGQIVGTATSSPFNYNWTNLPAGIFSVRARALDEIGGTTTSTNSAVVSVGTPPTTGANIAWVSFHPADDRPSTDAATAGFTKAADVAYTDLLKANGHSVTRVVTSGTPDTALLNSFDLVIISRSVPSGDYETPPETLAWNGITAPTMILGGYAIRNNRLGFTTGATIPDIAGPIKLTVVDPAHPIFEGVALDASKTMVNEFAHRVTFNNIEQRGISVNTDPIAEGGKVLATVGTAEDPAFEGMIIGEWQAGAKTANARADTLGGPRLIFLTGSRENDGLTTNGAGIYDLGPDGAKLFLNAVNYIAGVEPPTGSITLSITRSAGNVTITWSGGGTLEGAAAVTGTWTTVQNASSPHTTPASDTARFFRVRQ